jgi:hypothetical protein
MMKADLKSFNERVEKIWPPPISFKVESKSKRSPKKGDDELDGDDQKKQRSFNIFLDPENKDSDKYTRKVAVFKDGTPEDFVRFLMEYEELFKAGHYITASQEESIYRCLLAGKAKEVFTSVSKRPKTENLELASEKQVDATMVLAIILNDIAKKYVGITRKNSARRQRATISHMFPIIRNRLETTILWKRHFC